MHLHERCCLYLTRTPDGDLIASLQARGFYVESVKTPAEALNLFKDHPCVGVLDLASGYGSEHYPHIEQCLLRANRGWVVLTDEEQMQQAIVRRLVSKYCFDYLTMPAPPSAIVDSAAHAHRMLELCASEPLPSHEKMVGNSDAMQHLFRTISKVASTTAPVFIYGESGTGKELTAAAIHQKSERRNGPFVAINCGAIPHSLLQSELFGYERGAFTGANQRRIGKIEAAHKGTLFLDEVGDLPMESQASLLRFLQEGQIERLGSTEPINVDVRVISATHVDTESAVAAKRFRSDLYHRLCVLRIDEPPLRARGADIELLANHVLERFRDESARRIRGFSPGAIEALYNCDWPGNVRELINRVRRAIVMAEGMVITAEDLELTEWLMPRAITLAEARDTAERAAIELALRRHRNRLNEAAQELGISRVTLYRLMGNGRARDLPHHAPVTLRPVA